MRRHDGASTSSMATHPAASRGPVSVGLALCLLAPCLLATGCQDLDVHEGTIVGNPGSLRAARSSTVDVDVAEAFVAEVVLFDCEGEAGFEEVVDEEVDLLDPQSTFADLDDGTWCGAELLLDEVFWVGGGEETSFELEGSELLVVLESTAGFVLAESLPTLWQLGPPELLTAELLAEHAEGSGDGGEAFLDLDDPDLDDLRAALEERSAVYEDIDGDGLISDPDENAGTLATGPGREDEAAGDADEERVTSKSGCARRSRASLLLLLLPLAGSLLRQGRCC